MSKWTSEIVDYIRAQYLVERKSAGEIAKALDFAFSRNAVTGKLLRIGALRERAGASLGKRHGLPKHPLPRRPVVSAKTLAKAKTARRGPEIAVPACEPAASFGKTSTDHADLSFVARTEALFQGSGLSLLQTTDIHCRWPAATQLGVPHVCGKEKVRGAYCAKHGQIAYGGLRKRRRGFHAPGDTIPS